MSTTVVLTVTPAEPVDPDRFVGEVPEDIAAALTALGQPPEAALVRSGSGPVRFTFHLRGPGRVVAGQRVSRQLRHLGYEADVCFSP